MSLRRPCASLSIRARRVCQTTPCTLHPCDLACLSCRNGAGIRPFPHAHQSARLPGASRQRLAEYPRSCPASGMGPVVPLATGMDLGARTFPCHFTFHHFPLAHALNEFPDVFGSPYRDTESKFHRLGITAFTVSLLPSAFVDGEQFQNLGKTKKIDGRNIDIHNDNSV